MPEPVRDVWRAQRRGLQAGRVVDRAVRVDVGGRGVRPAVVLVGARSGGGGRRQYVSGEAAVAAGRAAGNEAYPDFVPPRILMVSIWFPYGLVAVQCTSIVSWLNGMLWFGGYTVIVSWLYDMLWSGGYTMIVSLLYGMLWFGRCTRYINSMMAVCYGCTEYSMPL